MERKRIGFIDSGVGGLTVLKEAMRQLPNESLIYLGDSARCPYGSRPVEQVQQFTLEMAEFLLGKNIKLLVIACNTATAAALDLLKERLPIPVIGVIIPGSRAAIKATKNQKIGVIATQGTIQSQFYPQAIHEKAPNIHVESLACPKLVPLIESNQTLPSIIEQVVEESLVPLKNSGIDTLILGCTHYPLLRENIQKVVGSEITLIDSGAETIHELSMALDYYHLTEMDHTEKLSPLFYTTGSRTIFKKIADRWLNLSNDQLQVEKALL